MRAIIDHKMCSNCLETLHFSQFHGNKKTKDGLCVWCKRCANDNARANYKKRMQDPEKKSALRKKQRDNWRQKKLEAIEMMGGKCQDCGGVFPPCCYDFHHLDPTVKEVHPSAAITSIKEWREEVEKCVLLCANCHRLRHWDEH